jgi:hypothetical protein
MRHRGAEPVSGARRRSMMSSRGAGFVIPVQPWGVTTSVIARVRRGTRSAHRREAWHGCCPARC